MLKGPVLKSLFRLAGPIVLANFLQTAYQLTDTFWVGRMGAYEVAALSLCFPLYFFFISLGGGFALSGTILVSQYSGQGRSDRVSEICFQTLFVILVVSLLLSSIMYFGVPFIIHAMTKNEVIANLAISYLKISLVGLVFSYLYMMFQSLYRGVGDVKTPFYIVLFTVVLNFFFDPILILGLGPIPAFGVDGAAYATIITQALAAVMGLFLLAKGKGGIHLDFSKTKLCKFDMKKIINLGIPASAEQSARSLAMVMLTFLVSGFGDIVLASYGIGIRVLSFIIIPALGFSMATSTLVGQNIGAEKIKRAKDIVKVALITIFIGMSFAGLGFFIFAEETLRFFVPSEAAVVKEGAIFIRAISLTFGFVGLQQVSSGALRGGGSTFVSMALAIVTLWMFRFPLAYILSHHTELAQKGIYWSFSVSSFIGAIFSLCVLRRGRWAKNVTDPLSEKEKLLIEKVMTEEGIRD